MGSVRPLAGVQPHMSRCHFCLGILPGFLSLNTFLAERKPLPRHLCVCLQVSGGGRPCVFVRVIIWWFRSRGVRIYLDPEAQRSPAILTVNSGTSTARLWCFILVMQQSHTSDAAKGKLQILQTLN